MSKAKDQMTKIKEKKYKSVWHWCFSVSFEIFNLIF